MVSLALVLLVSLLASACGSTPAATTPATPAPTAQTTAGGAGKLSGTVTFWSTYNITSPEFKTLTEEVIPAFNKQYPGIKIDMQAMPYDKMLSATREAIKSGHVPDLMRADIVWVPELVELGALAKLDEQIPDFASYKDTFYPGPLATNAYRGHYYGLPLDTNTRVLFYNQALFDKAGISAPPKTIAEFLDACAKLKGLGQPKTYCYAERDANPWSIMPLVWSMGGSITNADHTKATGYLNSPATVKAVTMLRDMLNDRTFSPIILDANGDQRDELAAGHTAMILDGPWAVSIFETQFPGFKYGMATVPAGEGGSSSVVGGEDIVLFERSKNKEAALAFMRYMLSAEAQTTMGKTGQMSALKSLASKEFPEYFSIFQKQLETAQPRTPSPAWDKIADVITKAVHASLSGKLEPQAALNGAAAEVDQLLANQE
jgi:multiple sugar transport system substrate-binding protein